MHISMKRLALGAGMTALLFGGLAPLAHADHPMDNPQNLCVHSTPDGANDGEGAIFHLLIGSETPTDDGESWSCSYTSEGAPDSTYTVASLGKVTISITAANGTVTPVLAKDATEAGGAPAASGPYSPAAGDVVTITLHEGCADGNCGASGEATLGAS